MADRASDEARRLIGVWGTMHDTMIRQLADNFGENGIRAALYEPLRRLGEAAAERRAETAPEIGREIMAFEALWGIEGRVLEERPDRFVREVTHCPWSYFHPLSCKVFGWWVEGFSAGMNGRFEYRLERLIPEAAETCAWSLSAREAEST